MRDNDLDFTIARLGECRIPSPMSGVRFTRDEERVLYHSTLEGIERLAGQRGAAPPAMESAGPRQMLFFDPAKLACGIVTCGGLCPGLNDVIRAIVLSLRLHYGVNKVYGFRFGYEGLVRRIGHEPLELTPESVHRIHESGGSILGSSRGPQDAGGNGRVPERAGGRDPLRHRRRRDASRGTEDRRGSGAARLEGRRHRRPEDDRQRHLVRAENVWIRDGGHRGAARDAMRPTPRRKRRATGSDS